MKMSKHVGMWIKQKVIVHLLVIVKNTKKELMYV